MSKTTKSLWLHRVGPLGLAGALVLPLSVTVAEAAEAGKQSVYEVRQGEIRKDFNQFESRRSAAMALADEGKYPDAIKALEALDKDVVKRPGNLAADTSEEINENIAAIKRMWSASLMKEANVLADAKRYDEAIAKAQIAQQLTPAHSYITAFISECQKMRQGAAFRKSVSLETVSPDYQSRQKQIDLDMREAKLFFRNKRYDSARNRLERVLLIDPFNTEAVDLLALIYDRLYNVGKKRQQEVEAMWLARNVWEWAEPIEAVQVDTTLDRSGQVRERGNAELYNRLERIVFPSVPLKNSTVKDVINYLNEKSRLYDKENKEGVTIIDNLPPEVKRRKVSLELGAMPLLDIIRYFSMASGLSYGFRDNRVIFGNVETLSTEYFPVHGDIIAEIIDSQSTKPTSSGLKGPEESGGGDGAPVEGEENNDETSTAAPAAAASGDSEQARISAALKDYFAARWVTFENGANIIYSPRGECLRVRNTPENLRRMDALLRQLNALDQPMIMVEAKLIELTDTNLNELGFEWTFSASRTKHNGWNLGSNDPTRHGNADGLFRVVNDLKIFPNFGEKIFGADTNVDLSLSVNAVAQNRKAEVLSSPRILSVSGPKTPASIKMTEKTYFITEWEEPDVETDGDNISIETEDPEWDEAVDLGVTFSVTPSVAADNYLITLSNIKPVFLTLNGYYTKNMQYEYGTMDASGKRTPSRVYTVPLKLPEIARREMLTNVNIYDGETVLIGGMTDNEVTARDDKWPILGDIPLLGNLFRDQQNNVRNKSLLIFITARLVNAKGEPWDASRASRNRGTIKFNR